MPICPQNIYEPFASHPDSRDLPLSLKITTLDLPLKKRASTQLSLILLPLLLTLVATNEAIRHIAGCAVPLLIRPVRIGGRAPLRAVVVVNE